MVGLADAAIARMMAKRPADRPASYDELIAELDRANPVRSRPTGLWPRLVAGLVDLILAALVAMPIGVFAENANIGLGLYFLVLAPLMLRRFGTTPGHALRAGCDRILAVAPATPPTAALAAWRQVLAGFDALDRQGQMVEVARGLRLVQGLVGASTASS